MKRIIALGKKAYCKSCKSSKLFYWFEHTRGYHCEDCGRYL